MASGSVPLHSKQLSSHEVQTQGKQNHSNVTKKVIFIALGLIILIAASAVTGALYSYLGYKAFGILTAGVILGAVLIVIGFCKFKSTAQETIDPLPVQQSQSQKETLAEKHSQLNDENDWDGTAATSDSFVGDDNECLKAKEKDVEYLEKPSPGANIAIAIPEIPVENIATAIPEIRVENIATPKIIDPLPVQHPQPKKETLAERRAKLYGENDREGIALTSYSFIGEDKERLKAKEKAVEYLKNPSSASLAYKEDLAMAIMLGMACGDAIGAPFEFLPFKKEKYLETQQYNKFKLKPGQWTDDTSMGLCLADSLIDNKELDTIQLMWAYYDWWNHAYNNAFTVGEPRHSVGLGGNINDAYKEFENTGRDATGEYATTAGTPFTSGNGSLMRNGPTAIAATSEKNAFDLAWRQSKVTHKGDEAAACCQLMSFFLFWALQLDERNPAVRKDILFKKLTSFNCTVPSVNGLAASSSAVVNPATKKEENWDWRNAEFKFNAKRLNLNSGYIGAYAMDGLAYALHCVYHTSSFEEAVLMATTHGGDADTIGAIAGQIAGAIYGVRAIPAHWIQAIHQWDRGGEIAARGLLLVSGSC